MKDAFTIMCTMTCEKMMKDSWNTWDEHDEAGEN